MAWIEENITVFVERPFNTVQTPFLTRPPGLLPEILDAALDTTGHLLGMRVEPPNVNDQVVPIGIIASGEVVAFAVAVCPAFDDLVGFAESRMASSTVWFCGPPRSCENLVPCLKHLALVRVGRQVPRRQNMSSKCMAGYYRV